MEQGLENTTKIAIVGPESSGKSSLSVELAQHFHTSCATEVARDYLADKNGSYDQRDLLEIAKLQLQEEAEKSNDAEKFLICDTNLLNIVIWSDIKYGTVDPLLYSLWEPNNYKLSLLCYPDLPYESDPLREHPSEKDRIKLFNIHQKHLEKYNSNYVIIKGIGEERIKNAIESIESFLSNR